MEEKIIKILELVQTKDDGPAQLGRWYRKG